MTAANDEIVSNWVMMSENPPSTWANAMADCVTTPNSTSPRMYMGATSKSGMSWVKIVIAVGEKPQVSRDGDDRLVIVDDLLKSLVQAVAHRLLGMHRGDRFRGFARLDQVVAEVGFFLELKVGESDQRAAQQDRGGGAYRRVHDRGEHEPGSDRPEHARKASEVMTALRDRRKNDRVVVVYDFTSSVIRSSGLSISSLA